MGLYGPRVAQKFAKIKPNVFCLSGRIKDTYKTTMGFEDEKLFVTPNGVNLDLFKKLKTHSIHNVQYILQRLIIGRGSICFRY